MSTNKITEDGTDWSRLSQWIQCCCVVTFDLNLGQALEFLYPPQFTPTEQEISNFCYAAFPDSNSGCMGDTRFHMRLRSGGNSTDGPYSIYNKECLPVMQADDSHLWGFVYFRQRRDADLPRGYFQKSFILLTRLPFFNLFYEIISQLAPVCFEEGNSVIERTCQQINERWPDLQTGVTLVLPLLNYDYEITIPKRLNQRVSQQSTGTREMCSSPDKPAISISSQRRKIITSLHELESFHCISLILDDIYTLWELVLTTEPIVVLGSSPADCSYVVQSLVALIHPLAYFGEARPYFTIHDSEFKEFSSENKTVPPHVILGVTNPYFTKLLKDWPHMIRLVNKQVTMQKHHNLRKNVNSCSATSFDHSNHVDTKKSSFHTLSNEALLSGLQTKYKPFLKKDKNFIKKVQSGIKTQRPDNVQSALVRKHLLELTQSFMIPLERYMASLMPLQKDISPFKSAPNANSFKLDDFLATLEINGPHLTCPLKGDWKGLYKKFFNSPNFRGWYNSRHRELQLTLQDLQLQALTEVNFEQWARDKQEVEIIDMILKLKQKLILDTESSSSVTSSYNSNNNGPSRASKIRAHIDCMKELLPQDLKNVVNI